MSDQNALTYILFRLKILPHTSGNVHKQRNQLFALPVHLLRQVTGSAGTAMDVLVTRALLTKGGEFERREPKMGGARHLRRRPFEHNWKLLFFRVFFREMSLKHSACHTFRASRVPCITFKSHLKSRKIESGVAF